MKSLERVSTGFKSLDQIIDSLRPGDNVVWQVDNIQDYQYFVRHYVARALESDKRIVYMRFADHPALIESQANVVIYQLDAASGFESFSSQVYTIVTQEGKGVYYVFDCLSDLLTAWATDWMIGNFFLIACPYLFELDTVAYFAILRHSHSFTTVAQIREITQVLLDVYSHEGRLCVHPLKVWQRYSPSMFFPHLKDGDTFVPVINSTDATRLFSDLSQKVALHAERKLDYWDRLFLQAEDVHRDAGAPEQQRFMVDKLCRLMISREQKILSLARNNFSLEDLLAIRKRLIGTGFIGGKAVGMLLARKVLSKDRTLDWDHLLEPHDSYFIGSDIYYTYLVKNGWWKLRMEQKTQEGYFDAARSLRERMMEGRFPGEIKEQFLQLIEYFGQSPIIVRSSSLLEDSYGNAFAGKYESIFCVNQGTPEERYAQFEESVRKIFASSMNEDALTYRLQAGLDQADEQMALLVQRVSGSYRKHYFFPDMGGVGISYNTFAWKRDMNPKAGMLRLVFGLGTRAVDRVEGDYPRIVALDEPLVKPHAGIDVTRRFSQHEVDVLDTSNNELKTISLLKLMGEKLNLDMSRVGVRDHETEKQLKHLGIKDKETWIITFDGLLSDDFFTDMMQRMMKVLETAYHYPVDIEYTVNFTSENGYRVNLVQCRPLQTLGEDYDVKIPQDIAADRIVFELDGNFIGGSISQHIKMVIYVVPERYSELPLRKKYDIASLVGKLNSRIADREKNPAMLLGPGRWGTTTPSLGVPVRFSQINNISVLGEVAYLGGNMMPELSFGTHFFQDLIEARIFYIAIFPWKEGVVFNEQLLRRLPNHLGTLIPEDREYGDVVKVYDIGGKGLHILADVVKQKVICVCETIYTG